MDLVVMLAIWAVIGVLAGAIADPIWKGVRPYGPAADYLVAVAAAVITGLVDWYLLPVFGITGALKFAIAVSEPALVALIALWAMRRFRR